MPKTEVVISNRLGLHARPSAALVRLAARYECTIAISNGDKTVNGKSIMGVMTLAANQGTVLTIEAVGTDATEALVQLGGLFGSNFGEGR
jgi:phosphocarrier protein HPr